jgi:hypothetical protein
MELRPEYKEELNKCREDINYFLENYMVVMKWGYFFKFEKRGYQDNIFNALCSQNKKIFITKERQIGMSMCAIFFAFWNSILNNNQTIFCCRNVDSVKNLQEKVEKYAKEMNRYHIFYDIKSDNINYIASYMGFENLRKIDENTIIFIDESEWVDEENVNFLLKKSEKNKSKICLYSSISDTESEFLKSLKEHSQSYYRDEKLNIMFF